MSTRTQILVETNEGVKIYKHSDGYPSGVLYTLKELLPAFQKNRGFDAEYLTAHISAAFINQSQKDRAYWDRKQAKKDKAEGKPVEKQKKGFDSFSFTGHGLDPHFHGDIEFLYYIRKDFSVEVYTPTRGLWQKDNITLQDFRPERKITLEELKGLKGRPYCNLDLQTLKPEKKKREKVTA